MMHALRRALVGALVSLLATGMALAYEGELRPGNVWGNPTSGAKPATDADLQAIFNQRFCTTVGNVIGTTAGSTWGCISLATPPAIGATTPNTGAFSTMQVTGLASAGTQCVQASSTGVLSVTGQGCGSASSGLVNSVANSDGTLTISPTAGAVVASIALGHSNIWTANTFFNGGTLNVGTSTNQTGNVFEVDGATGNPVQESIITWDNNDTSTAYINLRKSKGGAIGTLASVPINDTIGGVAFRAVDTTPVFQISSQILGLIDAAPSAGTSPGRLSFQTAPGPTERLRVDSNGVTTLSNLGGAAPASSNGYTLEVLTANNAIGLGAVAFYGYGVAFPTVLDLYNTAGGTPNTATLMTANTTYAEINFAAPDGVTYQRGASIIVSSDGTPAANSMPTRMIFATTPLSGTTSAERWRIDNQGRLISGATAIQVVDSSINPFLELNGTTAPTSKIASIRWSADVSAPALSLAKSRGAAIGTHGAVTTNDNLGIVFFDGDDGTNFQVGGQITTQVDAAVSAGVVPGRMLLSTANVNGTITEAMRIDSAQRTIPKSLNGVADLREWATLSCNTASPSSTNVAQAILNANQAGWTHFFIPAGCFWDTTSVPNGSGWTARTIPAGFHLVGEDWTLSGISADTSHPLVLSANVVLDNLFVVDTFCFNLDNNAFGHPAMCPVGHVVYLASGNFVVYPFQAMFVFTNNFTIPAFGGNASIASWPDGPPGYGGQNSSGGDSIFLSQTSGNSGNNLINGAGIGGAIFQVKADGRTNIGNASTSATGTGILRIQDATGECDLYPAASPPIGQACSSSRTLKTDIIDSGDALTWLASFRVRDFTLKANGERYTGIIAEELQENHPEMVRQGGRSLLAEGPNTWKIVRAMQQLQAEIEELKRRVH